MQAALKDVIYRYDGESGLTKGAVYSQITSNFDYYSKYKIGDTGADSAWGGREKNDTFPLNVPGKYDVQGGSLTWKLDWKFTKLGTLTFVKTWKSTFTFNIPEGGVEVIGAQLVDNVVTVDDGAEVKF